MRIVAGLGLVLAVTTARGSAAQGPGDFGKLKPGQTVRVSTAGGSRFETRLGGAATAVPEDLFADAEVPFQAARVDSLWVRGHATWTGAIVGAAVATPVSFAFWGWVCTMVGEGNGCDQWGGVSLMALVGGAGGALLGAGVGALIPKWRLRYARAHRVTIAPLLAPGRVGVTVGF